MRLRLPRPCSPKCLLCTVPLEIHAGPPSDELAVRLDHATRTDQSRVYLQQDGESSLVPGIFESIRTLPFGHLDAPVIGRAHQLGLPPGAPSLNELGIRQAYVTLFGPTAETHDRHTRAGDFQQTTALLRMARRLSHLVSLAGHTELTTATASVLPEITRFVASIGIAELLVSDSPGSHEEDPRELIDALEKAWIIASEKHVRLRFLGFAGTWHVAVSPGAPASRIDASLVESIRAGIPLPSPLAGIRVLSGVDELARTGPHLAEIGLELAARMRPALDLPVCLGGVRDESSSHEPGTKSEDCRSCPVDDSCGGASKQLRQPGLDSVLRPRPFWRRLPESPRVLVVSPIGWDPIFYVSSLPGLARTLEKRGAKVDLISPWRDRWVSDVVPLRELPTKYDGPDTEVDRWLDDHDLLPYDLVIAADPIIARRVLDRRPLRPDARMIVVDFHMLRGIDSLVKAWCPSDWRPGEGGWWRHDNVTVESGFPGYVHLYQNYGVPLRQVRWRPVTMYPGHFPLGPDVMSCDTIMSGGNHLRDLDTLCEATATLPDPVHPVHVYSEHSFETRGKLKHCGRVNLDPFYEAIATSRFVVIPMIEDRNRAAGITVFVMAFLAGRPIIASSTAAARDYIHDGIDGLLVPPGDVAALREAIRRLDTDTALLTKLAEGARRQAHLLSTDHWADEILGGSRVEAPVRNGTRWGCW